MAWEDSPHLREMTALREGRCLRYTFALRFNCDAQAPEESLLEKHSPASATSWVSRLGMLSYAFYLTHALLLSLAERWLPTPPSMSHRQLILFRGKVACVLTLAASWMIHQWVEKPFLRLRLRLDSSTQSPHHKQSAPLVLNHV